MFAHDVLRMKACNGEARKCITSKRLSIKTYSQVWIRLIPKQKASFFKRIAMNTGIPDKLFLFFKWIGDLRYPVGGIFKAESKKIRAITLYSRQSSVSWSSIRNFVKCNSFNFISIPPLILRQAVLLHPSQNLPLRR